MLKLTMLLLAIVFGGSSALAEQKVICNYPSSGSWTDAEVAEWSNACIVDNCLAGTNDKKNGLLLHLIKVSLFR